MGGTREEIQFIALQARAEAGMRLSDCHGCDGCGLRCAAGVPATRAEWETLQAHIASASEERRASIEHVQAQEKTVELGEGVTARMCRFRDMEAGCCAVYAARPLACRLLGHVEWMPCPIEKPLVLLPTPQALELMREYARFERRTFEEWETLPPPSDSSER